MQGLKKFKQVPYLHVQSRVLIAINDDYASKKLGGIVNFGKHRRSRWDPQPEGDGHTSEDEKIHKASKTRWDSNESKLKLSGSVEVPVGFKLDPEIQKLKAELSEIDEKLQKYELHDDRPKHERSPSPEPLYNNFGT
ncbi:splicing factor-like protein 1 [Hibiscus syriacus]|uniref:splicing factor-like protein 1 n=1 Tax=Hibiscus syriacus TaxID=106335 RepID=UPI001923C1C4|nr:splicing factor-like protein 1 [Hibiscus syriacus]